MDIADLIAGARNGSPRAAGRLLTLVEGDRRDEVLAVVTAMLATDTAAGWERRLRPLGVPAAAVRTLPEALEATPEVVVAAGDFRLVGSPIHVSGYEPEYRPPPELSES